MYERDHPCMCVCVCFTAPVFHLDGVCFTSDIFERRETSLEKATGGCPNPPCAAAAATATRIGPTTTRTPARLWGMEMSFFPCVEEFVCLICLIYAHLTPKFTLF